MQTSIIPEHSIELVEIPIEMISIDVYPREAIDTNRIIYLKSLLDHGTDIAPIKVVEYNNGYSCIDGVHRFEARKSLKESTIQCVLLDIKNDLGYFLLHAAAFNNNTAKPLSRSELKHVVIESFNREIPVKDIIDILQMKKTFIYSILSPLLKKKKDELKKKAVYLYFVEEKKISEIHEILGAPKPTLIRWFKEAEDANLFDQDIFDQIKTAFGYDFSVGERLSFFCLQQMARGTSMVDISEHLNVKPKWIISVGITFLHVLKYKGNDECRKDVFSLETHDILSMIDFLHSYFKKLLPGKMVILSWLNDHREFIQNHTDFTLMREEMIAIHKECHMTQDKSMVLHTGDGACDQHPTPFKDEGSPEFVDKTIHHSSGLQINFQELDKTVETLVGLQDHIVVGNHDIDHETAKVILETFNRIQIIMNLVMPKLVDFINLHR
ncbi:MAG: ParB N-terminal domain-containing protein [Proteobacteria bacterium]|nr:ParB N-terminal domain-containing protein [Pseudomonadota bacterium]